MEIKTKDYGLVLSCSDELIEEYMTKRKCAMALKDWPRTYRKVFPECAAPPRVHMAKWNGVFWGRI